MKITDSEVIKNGEHELIDAITADLDWGSIEDIFRERHNIGIDEDVKYKHGDIVVHNNRVAYKLEFEVKVSVTVLLDRDGNHISVNLLEAPEEEDEEHTTNGEEALSEKEASTDPPLEGQGVASENEVPIDSDDSSLPDVARAETTEDDKDSLREGQQGEGEDMDSASRDPVIASENHSPIHTEDPAPLEETQEKSSEEKKDSRDETLPDQEIKNGVSHRGPGLASEAGTPDPLGETELRGNGQEEIVTKEDSMDENSKSNFQDEISKSEGTYEEALSELQSPDMPENLDVKVLESQDEGSEEKISKLASQAGEIIENITNKNI